MAKNRKPGAARAARLHKQFEKLQEGEGMDSPRGGSGSDPGESRPLSPREFIHKRMAELDKKKDA